MTEKGKSSERWRGLAALVQDAVEHGSRAVERVQKATAQRPFAILEKIPPIASVARGIHAVHDASVSGAHGAIRAVNRVAARTITVVVDAVSERGEGDGSPAPGPNPDEPRRDAKPDR